MESTGQIVILIAIAALTVVSLFLGMIAFLNVHRKRMALLEQEKQLEIFKAAGEAEEQQKDKISRNIHDQVLGELNMITVSMSSKIKILSSDGIDANVFKKDIDSINKVLKDIRDISHDLVPRTVLHFGLVTALKNHIERGGADVSNLITFKNLSGYTSNIPFEIGHQLNIYRICVEILNNINKHSVYKSLLVLLEGDKKNLYISFIHDGKGVTNEEIETLSKTSTGLGLKSLKSRALLLNGKISYFVEDELANVLIEVPYNK